jgi:[acyl-carrier-protein] S-malonyltransferase
MGAELFPGDSFFRGLIRRASEGVGADLERICLRGPDRALARNRILQPLLVCVSLGYWRQLTERGVRPDIVLGHSLGEISALAAAEILEAEAAVDIAIRRGELMGRAAARVEGGMLAIVSPARERVLGWLKDQCPDGRVVLANDNAPDQLVLSGESEALAGAARFVAEEHLGTCRRLAVSGPWHSSLLRDAQREFGAWLNAIEFRPPRVPIICNGSAAPETDPERIRELIVANLTGMVRWRQCLECLKHMQAAPLVEVGPGRVLAGLARANGFGNDVRILNVNNLRGVDLASSGSSPA